MVTYEFSRSRCRAMSRLRDVKQAVDDVTRFHRVFGQPVLDKPTVPNSERVELRADLLAEEFVETMAGLGYDVKVRGMRAPQVNPDMVKLADGLADLVYVAIGCALEFGIPLDRVWAEVHRSNMAKAGPDGVVKYREDGKVLKPDTWTPPDIAGVLASKS